MKFLLQKAGLTVLVLSWASMGTIAPAIAEMIDSKDDITSDITAETVEDVTDTVEAEVAPEVLPEEASIEGEDLSDELSETSDTEEIAATDDTILEVASSSESFTTLVSAINETELEEVLQGDGPFTVFAPTDEAFEALPEGTVETLMAPENRDILVSLLSYHVVAEELSTEQLESGLLDSVQGTPLQVDVGEDVTVNGVTINDDEISASNGVIHVIDQVILPPQQ